MFGAFPYLRRVPLISILLPAAYAALGVFLIYKLRFFEVQGLSRRFLSGVFLLKILAGTALVAIYTYYYTDRSTADVFKYFDDSKVMFNALRDKPADYFQMLFGINNDSPYFDKYYDTMNNWYRVYESNLYNDSHTIIRFNAVVMLFSGGHIGVHTVFMCFIALMGLAALYKVFSTYIIQNRQALTVGIFLLPSVVFWGSGVLKEGLLFFAIGTAVFCLEQLLSNKGKWWHWPGLFFALALMFICKMYVLIALFPGIVAYTWIRLSSNKRVYLKYLVVILICTVAAVNIKVVLPKDDFLETLSEKQRDFMGLAESMNSGSIIHINKLEPTFKSFAMNAPEAFINTLCRPFIWEAKTAFEWAAAIENLFLIAFIIYAFVKIDVKKLTQPLVPFCITFVLVLYVLSGIATPVVGALVRYKVPAMPFLVIALLLVAKDNAFPTKQWVNKLFN